MIRRKVILFFSFLLIIFLVLVVFFSRVTYKATVFVDGKTFSVEVAETEHLLEKGLSGHAPLLPNEGMLFVFSKPDKYGFWMKDMGFPIDIIWVGPDFKVVHVEKSVSPETYPKVFTPTIPALYVLEVLAGQAELLKIKIGDSVQITKKWL